MTFGMRTLAGIYEPVAGNIEIDGAITALGEEVVVHGAIALARKKLG